MQDNNRDQRVVATRSVYNQKAIQPNGACMVSVWLPGQALSLRRFHLINISCHCGNVNLAFEQLPAVVRDCDCPMCNRLGALWGDFVASDVVVEVSKPTATYQWGDGDYEMHHCTSCGCSTHYTATDASKKSELGINLRMLDRKQLEQIPIVG